ncbi:AcrR family transcriptional regulator [Aequitasia blattaphilus]|uniref:TetR/AcrR family transcriptional regulator n=1 Tax=Aequitasia blattaphilus TaxID=2949332 RepID=A0ABT1EEI2_9FIRM|nr:TetR/AcrR family transcriptional regulator [Aequitasia blattaphilus]MCP1102877.1 TetR/AcrR family transcriptional regulator [Aequitasia blattaphilus]MCR8615517.1 TetR/AcrR family transcriptional regulator [Aequitasia blattaphilus]
MGNTAITLDEKQGLRKKIIDTSVALITQDGYENFSLRKVAQTLDLQLPTLRLFYKTKKDVIADMADTLYYKIMLDAITLSKGYPKTTHEDQIRAQMQMFIYNFIREPEMTKAIMYSGVNEMFAARNQNSMPHMSGMEIFDEQLKQGSHSMEFKPYVAGTTWMILSSMTGFIVSCLENKLYESEQFDSIVLNYINLLIGGIKA